MLREMISRGHSVYVVSPIERRDQVKTTTVTDKAHILCVRTLNNTKVNLFEKALALISTPQLLYRGIRREWKNVRFDLIIYSTPPITIAPSIAKLKKRYNAMTYCLLKDIWPQTAVDLGSLKENSLTHRYLRWQEKRLYACSDYIGCMSQGNVDYVLRYNKEFLSANVEVCPNSIEVREVATLREERDAFRESLNIPQKALLCLYGGNLGVPQGIPFVLDILRSFSQDRDVFFLLIGSGTQFKQVQYFMKNEKLTNTKLLPFMDKEKYQRALVAADVGLVFLNKTFTTPNIPSRTLDYMEVGLPVLAAVDAATDFGDIIEAGGFGRCCLSGDVEGFRENLLALRDADLCRDMGQKGRAFLEENWTVKHTCDIILKHPEQEANIDGRI